MKLVSPKLSLLVASAALVLAGCTKKPARPDPSATMLGQQGSGTATAGTPTDALFGGAQGALIERTGGDFDPNGHNRTALEAQTVYFDYDRSDIKASERPKLQAAKDYLDKNPTFRLLLEGHCDWRGTAEYNLGLGDRRAAGAKKFLLSIGVPADRIETLSKGSLEAAKNADDATMGKDRRVNLVVINPTVAATPL
ncbi:MAG: hypothetical protein B9S34_03435 [Opitutia bacterium Tous-C1TDCM]|nr:MAG: hypothetical protein B9S34_03435 [Opitutae bacterium Tous-C1TDCM]